MAREWCLINSTLWRRDRREFKLTLNPKVHVGIKHVVVGINQVLWNAGDEDKCRLVSRRPYLPSYSMYFGQAPMWAYDIWLGLHRRQCGTVTSTLSEKHLFPVPYIWLTGSVSWSESPLGICFFLQKVEKITPVSQSLQIKWRKMYEEPRKVLSSMFSLKTLWGYCVCYVLSVVVPKYGQKQNTRFLGHLVPLWPVCCKLFVVLLNNI